MGTINSLLEGANPFKALQNEAGKLSAKWNRSGLLEGIDNSTEKNNMAILLENQAKQLVNESNSLGSAGTGQSVTAGANSEAWAGVALPLVRRVFGEIVAKDLVSVQPMNLPAGLIFYLDFRYGESTLQKSDGGSLYSATSDMKKTSLPSQPNANSGLYGAGTFAYSITSASTADLHLTGGVAGDAEEHKALISATTASTSPLLATDSASVQYDQEFLTYLTDNSVTLTSVAEIRFGTGSFTNGDYNSVRTWKVLKDDDTEATNYNQFNVWDQTNNTVVMYILDSDLTFSTGKENVKVMYNKAPDNLNDRGDFEDTIPVAKGTVSELNIPEINVQMRSDTVAAKTRKLKAQWTPEFAQDLNAYHSIDAEAELTSILSEYISMEIDLEILEMLIANADTVDGWSAKINREVSTPTLLEGTKHTSTFTDSSSGTYYTKMSWFQTLGVKLQKVSNKIHQKTLRGGANFMVVSPTISTILESIPGFAADSTGDDDKYAMGVQKIGAINSRYTVYKNPYMTENIILMGYKGSQFLETGAVFAPYIPLIMTPLVYDPTSFTPRKGIMTRYAKKMVRPDFYGKVVIHNIDQI